MTCCNKGRFPSVVRKGLCTVGSPGNPIGIGKSLPNNCIFRETVDILHIFGVELI